MQPIGSVLSIWRYPVKSMGGEIVYAVDVTPQGIAGDHVYAVVDSEAGEVGSAKHAARWGNLLACSAAYLGKPMRTRPTPISVTVSGQTQVASTDPAANEILSAWVGRPVRLVRVKGSMAGPYFDNGPLELLTTSTLRRLRELYPFGDFDVRRFRPSLVIKPMHDTAAFIERQWVGRTLTIGGTVRLRVTEPCARTAVVTLAQHELPEDPGVLRAIAQHADGHAGVVAEVAQEGTIQAGDPVVID